MKWQPGEYRIKNGNRAYVFEFDAHSPEPIIGKVLSNEGWSMQWWYADGSYHGDRPSLWDLIYLPNPVDPAPKPKPHIPAPVKPPEPEAPKQEEMLVTPKWRIGGKDCYLYALIDTVHNGGISPLRVSRNPSYGDGYVRLDALHPDKGGGETFQFAIENPVYDNRE